MTKRTTRKTTDTPNWNAQMYDKLRVIAQNKLARYEAAGRDYSNLDLQALATFVKTVCEIGQMVDD